MNVRLTAEKLATLPASAAIDPSGEGVGSNGGGVGAGIEPNSTEECTVVAVDGDETSGGPQTLQTKGEGGGKGNARSASSVNGKCVRAGGWGCVGVGVCVWSMVCVRALLCVCVCSMACARVCVPGWVSAGGEDRGRGRTHTRTHTHTHIHKLLQASPPPPSGCSAGG